VTLERPQLEYKINIFPSSAHIYVGIPCPEGWLPAELIVPGGHFLTEALRNSWGARDKARHLRYRVCVVKVDDVEFLETAINNRIAAIKTEWQDLLDQTTHQAHIAKLSVPDWTPLP